MKKLLYYSFFITIPLFASFGQRAVERSLDTEYREIVGSKPYQTLLQKKASNAEHAEQLRIHILYQIQKLKNLLELYRNNTGTVKQRQYNAFIDEHTTLLQRMKENPLFFCADKDSSL